MHLYIHVPFCKQKCSYCNFHFSTNLKYKNDLIKAIVKEIQLRKQEIQQPLETIYFGGGTPSVLSENELNIIFKAIEQTFQIQTNAEITIETNPDDLTQKNIQNLKKFPINRFSIGVQSFFDKDLQLMNRAHNAREADASIKRVQDAGFENITIDLIYGSPTTTDAMWQQNLNQAIALQVPHISSYALTVEPKTLLQHQIQKRILKEIDEEKQQRHFLMLNQKLTQNGFQHYEISNFGKPGFHSRHNSAYWKGEPYVGIGPSAHSFNIKSRSWNIANNIQYMQSIQNNEIPQEIEILSEKDQLNECIMIGLRTIYGIDVEKLNSDFSLEIIALFQKNLEPFLAKNQIIQKEKKLYLHPDFRFFADGIASELFIV